MKIYIPMEERRWYENLSAWRMKIWKVYMCRVHKYGMCWEMASLGARRIIRSVYVQMYIPYSYLAGVGAWRIIINNIKFEAKNVYICIWHTYVSYVVVITNNKRGSAQMHVWQPRNYYITSHKIHSNIWMFTYLGYFVMLFVCTQPPA